MKTVREYDLRQQSEQDRIEHEMMRLPSRSRCSHCMKGREARAGLSHRNSKIETSPRNPFELHGVTTGRRVIARGPQEIDR